MIKINFKYALIAFLILVISSCAIVLLTINSNDESSSTKLITSVYEDSNTSDSTETSKVSKKKTTSTKASNKTSKNNRTRGQSTSAKSSKKTTSTTTSVKFPLDINKATKDELMQIDGVGEVTSKKILSYRKKLKYYCNLLQLKDVDGIGDATYEKLKKYLYVSSDKYKEMEVTSASDKSKTTSKTTKAKTTKVKTTKRKTSKTTIKAQSTEINEMTMVNINTAGKEELMDSLLIDEEEALLIIDFRTDIGGKFTDTLELLYKIGKSEYNRIKDYITV